MSTMQFSSLDKTFGTLFNESPSAEPSLLGSTGWNDDHVWLDGKAKGEVSEVHSLQFCVLYMMQNRSDTEYAKYPEYPRRERSSS